MRLLLASDAPWTGGYSSPAVREPWPPGEVREVEPVVGGYLLATFPGLFSDASAEADEPTQPPAPQPVAADTAAGPIPDEPAPKRRR